MRGWYIKKGNSRTLDKNYSLRSHVAYGATEIAWNSVVRASHPETVLIWEKIQPRQ